MAGLSKTGQQNALARLYERNGIKYNMHEIQKLSTGELRHKINEIRGHKRKKAGRMVEENE